MNAIGTEGWHREQVIKAARRWFAKGDAVVEDVLDAIMEAGRREFGCRVVVCTPAQFLVDGGRFVWPEGERHA